MKCNYENRDEVIAKYLNRELSEQEVVEFQEHFFNCDICFQELKFKRDALELIKAEGDAIFAGLQVEPQGSTKDWDIFYTIRNVVQALRRKPVLGFGLTGIAVLLLATVIFFARRTAGEANLLASLNYGSRVPYEYSPPATLRGEGDNLRGPLADSTFIDNFQRAMLRYNDLNYEAAIRKLGRIEQAAGALEERDSLSATSARVLWDYYFYRGLSHLGFAGDTRIKLPGQEQQEHLAHALDFLTKSREIARRYAPGEPEKESYFLGIVHAAAGDRETALRELKNVAPNSPFFKQSEEIARKLSR